VFDTILVASRGGVAVKIIDTCRRLGVKSVAVYSDIDADALHVSLADESLLLGPAPLSESYVDVDRIIEAARVTGARAVHPGDGLLAGEPSAAARVREAGLGWVGPGSEALTLAADQPAARDAAAAAGVPITEETGGAPHHARRIDVTLLGLVDHRIVAVSERDSSVRSGSRTLVDDVPPPASDADLRRRLRRAAAQIAETVDYRGLGTVRFLVDRDSGELRFGGLEPRLSAGLAVTELVTGIDLVEQQLLIASGQPVSFDADEPPSRGHAVGVRIYAEDLDTVPAGSTRIATWELPGAEGVRMDSGYRPGDTVTRHYDPLLGVLAAWGDDRRVALARLRMALAAVRLDGPAANLDLLVELLDDSRFDVGDYDVGLLQSLRQ
jgi:acetyl/propionyl-CoA carboxylase alpha subunit